MRSSPALVSMEFSTEPTHTRTDEIVRKLAELVGAMGTTKAHEPASYTPSEEVLLDTEIHGSRYLLVRMPKPASSQVRLSPREQEIVRMVAKGHPNKVIADVLNISSWTVCTHLRRIFAKLGVGS